jgi:hypothetical protein
MEMTQPAQIIASPAIPMPATVSKRITDRVMADTTAGVLYHIRFANLVLPHPLYAVDVPSQSQSDPRRVIYDSATDTTACDCPAGIAGRFCTHAYEARIFLSLIPVPVPTCSLCKGTMQERNGQLVCIYCDEGVGMVPETETESVPALPGFKRCPKCRLPYRGDDCTWCWLESPEAFKVPTFPPPAPPIDDTTLALLWAGAF